MKRILTGSIFYAPDTGGGGGGAAPTSEGGGDGQTKDSIVDPFAGIDMDLLDDDTRAKVATAKAEFAKTAEIAKTAKDHQSRYDALKAEVDKQQADLQQLQTRPQQQAEPSFEDKMRQTYMENGFTKEQADNLVKINKPIFNDMGQRTARFVDDQVMPLKQQLATQRASDIFQGLQYMEEYADLVANPEISQTVWDKCVEAIERGVELTPGIVENYVKIFGFEHLRKNPMQTQQTTPPVRQNGTRHTYPGAGHLSRRPVTTGVREEALDPDTAAAVAATKEKMRASFAPNTGPKVTRGI